MDIDDLIDEVIGREGGYTNNKADRGGATRWGITEKVARANGYAGDMRALPRETAATIYRRLYWQKPGYDRVATRVPLVAAELFDTGVNMGPKVATGFLQRALNALNRGASDYPDIAADGLIGPRTLSALDGFVAKRGAAASACWSRRSRRFRARATWRWPRAARPMRRSFTAGSPTGSAELRER